MTSGYRGSPINATQPNIARVYDYLLGGKDNFEVDRELGDKIKDAMPGVRLGVEQQRAVLRRVVRYLVGEAGIGQIIDIGSGLPTAGNVHETAREIDPGTRVVYVDHDPVVLTHARALMSDDRTTIAIGGDARDIDGILGSPDLKAHVDLDRPVGLLLCGILHHILDDEDPFGMVAAYRAALPSGSYLFIHHLAEVDDPMVVAAQAELQRATGRGQFRPPDRIALFFDGLEMVDPGLVSVTEWRPDATTPSVDTNPVLRLAVAGLARKP